MQDEIEFKIMLDPKNIPIIIEWINQQAIIHYEQEYLENTYYDSKDHFFEKNQMGLRVRTKNNKHQITLKMQGNVIGGLHIRPEYNLELPSQEPDFQKLCTYHQLPFTINSPLYALFTTHFIRKKWLITVNKTQIEIALDQGRIKNLNKEEAICEIELELKQGDLSAMFHLLNNMPKKDGMWLSSLSKAQRGYFIGHNTKIEMEISKLTSTKQDNLTEMEKYQLTQQLADFIRITKNENLIKYYQSLTNEDLTDSNYLYSQTYLIKNIQLMNDFYNN